MTQTNNKIIANHIIKNPRDSGWHCNICGRKLYDKEQCTYTPAILIKHHIYVNCLHCGPYLVQGELLDDLDFDQHGRRYNGVVVA